MVMAESDVQSKEEGKTMVFIPVGRTVQRPTILPTTCSFRRLYVHVCLFAVVVIVILVLRAISNVRVVFVQYHSSSDTDGELVVLPEKFAVSRGAYCLDGSSPGYYIRYGKSPNLNKWIIHLPAGAWCSSVEDCYSRSFTELGSSVEAPMFRAFNGILSPSESENPKFHMWNMVDFLYCDGGSFLGNRNNVISHKSKKLYLAGFQVFNALIDYLVEHTELKGADQVILIGSSAGGVGATVNADYLRKRLTGVNSLHLVVDGAMFVDNPEQTRQQVMRNIFKNTFYLHNIQGAESIQECTQKLPGDDQWQCLQPTFFYKHLFTPVFFLNSLHDAWYSKNAMGVNCPFSTCSQGDINILDQHRSSLLSRASSILQSLQDGIYLTSCPVHTMTMNKRFSSQLSEGGISPQNALMKWYFHQVPNYTFVENIDFRKATAVCKLDS